MNISGNTYKLLVASKLKGVGRKTLLRLSDDKLIFGGDVKEVCLGLIRFKNLDQDSLAIDNAIALADKDVARARESGHLIFSIFDPVYPRLLRELVDRPVILYASGDISKVSEKSIAIVGTREPSEHGEIIANRVTKYFSDNGWQVVSGLAVGIDTIAHKVAIQSGAVTVAVLATGLDVVYPKQNAYLAREIVEKGGLLLSEYPYETKGHPSYFVERDRLQAALALGVFMVQSDEGGGSWHASRASMRYGRYLFVPMPTAKDLKLQHRKVRGNSMLSSANADSRASFLKCKESDLAKFSMVSSRNDYPLLEKKMLSLNSLATSMSNING
jgi:DNA processing protein